jgi:hypothetical protein
MAELRDQHSHLLHVRRDLVSSIFYVEAGQKFKSVSQLSEGVRKQLLHKFKIVSCSTCHKCPGGEVGNVEDGGRVVDRGGANLPRGCELPIKEFYVKATDSEITIL